VTDRLSPLGRKVFAIVNYDDFDLDPELTDAYTVMVQDVADRFYTGVTRYTTSAFLRAKLGDALTRRGLAARVYESAEEARSHLQSLQP
jgi:propionate CoA-transferase